MQVPLIDINHLFSANTHKAREYVEDFRPSCYNDFFGTNGHIDNYTCGQKLLAE
ncbi:MAG TPA: hypothetical protein VGE93_18485 [Bryobacteraceae bacterium]